MHHGYFLHLFWGHLVSFVLYPVAGDILDIGNGVFCDRGANLLVDVVFTLLL